MDLGLASKGVVVTGGSRGIGRAIALAFADEGADVAICARGEDALRRTEEELRARGVKVHAQVCDVSDEASLDAFLDQSKQALGQINVLVNNASAFGMADNDEAWRAGFEVDVLAAVRATRRALPEIEAAGGGAVIFISSTAALEAPAGPPYSAMKAALISYSKNLAVQLATRNIRVNTVAPGSIDFPGGVWDAIKQTSPERYESIRQTIPAGRLGTPEEVANAVVFLASERASWITGVTLSVDGSQHKANL